MEATSGQIKAVGMILHGDKQDHKPCWYTDTPGDALPGEMKVEDDDPLPFRLNELFKSLGIPFIPHFNPGLTAAIDEQRTNNGETLDTDDADVGRSRSGRAGPKGQDKSNRTPPSKKVKSREGKGNVTILNMGKVRKLRRERL